MKTFIIAALAASVVATPVLAAPHSGYANHGRVEQRHDDRGPQRHQVEYRKWKKGERFDSRQVRTYRVISNPGHYKLRPAPRGYRWVQSNNDAVLIGITSGIVAAVMANIVH